MMILLKILKLQTIINYQVIRIKYNLTKLMIHLTILRNLKLKSMTLLLIRLRILKKLILLIPLKNHSNFPRLLKTLSILMKETTLNLMRKTQKSLILFKSTLILSLLYPQTTSEQFYLNLALFSKLSQTFQMTNTKIQQSMRDLSI